jgi:hypothetical protein
MVHLGQALAPPVHAAVTKKKTKIFEPGRRKYGLIPG